jgi:hypothetical protein
MLSPRRLCDNADHLRGVLPSVVCRTVIMKLDNEEALGASRGCLAIKIVIVSLYVLICGAVVKNMCQTESFIIF